MTRVAVIGAGPRAGQALERLSSLGRQHCVGLPEVDVIAPGESLGAGETYAPGQPGWLRLNVASSQVDAWSQASEPDPTRVPFDAWRDADDSNASSDQFPPRSEVGRYLSEAGERVRLDVPGSRRSDRVIAVRPSAEGWTLLLQSGRRATGYTDVLLCTGHAADWTGALSHHTPAEMPLVPHVFPVGPLMERAAGLRPGDTVVVRGAALTAIDTVLTLVAVSPDPGIHIVLASRTGRLMAPKTESRVLASLPGSEDIAEHGRRMILGGASIPRILMDTATRLLVGVGSTGGAGPTIDAAVCEVLARRTRNGAAWLRGRLAIASGQSAPDATWALAQAWRLCYPALVARQDALPPGTSTLDWRDYALWAAEMERLAFGPPPANASALSALLDTGTVEVVATDDVPELARSRRAALVVDAVLPPPGLRGIQDPLVEQLVDEGLLAGSRHGRGVLVDRDATCLVRGTRVTGLSVVGRLTEDVVIGNDTLVRNLHPHIDRWAHRILGLEWVGESCRG